MLLIVFSSKCVEKYILMRLSIMRVNYEICCWPADDRCGHA